MPARRLTTWLVLAALLIAGRSSGAAAAEWRELLAKDHAYVAPAPKPTQADDRPAWLLASAPAPADPGVVRLPPVEVRAHPIYDELAQSFADQTRDARNREIADKLGIGFKGLHNKHAAIGVITVLYVPVLVIGGVSW